ncbi:MAG: glucose dehydrogenase, partial [Candidatus Aminicenantes bacterium]|nr:glucose dehydrogenase [Candidatus Aminicenantes bacterium]
MPENKNWQIRDGFKIEKVVSGLLLPVNLAFVPNPKPQKSAPFFYVTELYGSIKVITQELNVFTFADNLLNYDPNYMMPGTGESGVIGIVAHENGDVFA